MATVAEVQAELGTDGMSGRILKTEEGATLRQNYFWGGAAQPGKCRWITTTIADSAANQVTALRAG